MRIDVILDSDMSKKIWQTNANREKRFLPFTSNCEGGRDERKVRRVVLVMR